MICPHELISASFSNYGSNSSLPHHASIHVRATVVVSELLTFELEMYAETASLVFPATPKRLDMVSENVATASCAADAFAL